MGIMAGVWVPVFQYFHVPAVTRQIRIELMAGRVAVNGVVAASWAAEVLIVIIFAHDEHIGKREGHLVRWPNGGQGSLGVSQVRTCTRGTRHPQPIHTYNFPLM